MNSDRLQDKNFSAETPPPLSGQICTSDTLRFTSRVLIAVGIVLSIFVIFLIFWYAFHVILVGFIGVILAVFLRGLADWLGKLTRLSPDSVHSSEF
ncbi:MAG: hypothetical protein ACXWM6_10480 [Thermodesulfobacteriota bacterium]